MRPKIYQIPMYFHCSRPYSLHLLLVCDTNFLVGDATREGVRSPPRFFTAAGFKSRPPRERSGAGRAPMRVPGRTPDLALLAADLLRIRRRLPPAPVWPPGEFFISCQNTPSALCSAEADTLGTLQRIRDIGALAKLFSLLLVNAWKHGMLDFRMRFVRFLLTTDVQKRCHKKGVRFIFCQK